MQRRRCGWHGLRSWGTCMNSSLRETRSRPEDRTNSLDQADPDLPRGGSLLRLGCGGTWARGCRRGDVPGRVLARPVPASSRGRAVFGYFLRMHLAGAVLPVAFGGDATLAFVGVHALAEGCVWRRRERPSARTTSSAASPSPLTIGAMLERFERYPGGMKVRLQLPRWFMRPPPRR